MSVQGQAVAVRDTKAVAAASEYVTLTIADQTFGVPVLQVRDVLRPQNITRVPLAQPEIAGALNLRGRIVTAVDMRIRLGLPPREASDRGMCVVVDYEGELYSLIVDKVGEVMGLEDSKLESNPATLAPRWREVSSGIYRLQDRLLVVLDIARLLRFDSEAA